MPAAAIPIITAIIGAAGVGTSIAGLAESGGSSGPSAQQLSEQQQQQAQADAQKAAQAQQLQKDQLLRRAAPDAQAQTGGSLTDAPLAQLIASISGQPGDVNSAMKFANGSNGSTAPFSLDSFANSLSGGS